MSSVIGSRVVESGATFRLSGPTRVARDRLVSGLSLVDRAADETKVAVEGILVERVGGDGSTSVTAYQIRFHDAFLSEMLGRQRSVQRGQTPFKIAKSCAMGFLVFACLSSAAQGWPIMAIMWAVIAFGLSRSHRTEWVDHWLSRRRVRHSPYWNQTVMVSVGPEGVRSESPTCDVMVPWSKYTRAILFADGVLLYQGPAAFQWLPDEAIVSGSREAVGVFVRSRVRTEEVRGGVASAG